MLHEKPNILKNSILIMHKKDLKDKKLVRLVWNEPLVNYNKIQYEKPNNH